MSESHSHSYAAANFNTAFAIGIALNLGFVLIEGFYGWKINSLALLADAGHNHSDVAGLLLAWGGALAGRLRLNAQHTYGWKRQHPGGVHHRIAAARGHGFAGPGSAAPPATDIWRKTPCTSFALPAVLQTASPTSVCSMHRFAGVARRR